jgi:putative transposase
MSFRPELIDELLKEYRHPEDLNSEGGIFKQLTKADRSEFGACCLAL